MRYFIFFIALNSLAFGDRNLFSKYETLHASTLRRLVNIENRIDGLSEEFRALLKDRKRIYDVDFKMQGKSLEEPLLTNAIITERKRLEAEESFLDDLRKSPTFAKQLQKKIASNLLALEATNIVITFVEFLDQYNRGERPYSGPKDLEVLKVLAGTYTALAYSKSFKERMALADPEITRLTQKESNELLSLIESGLGKMKEDTLLFIPETVDKKERRRLEFERLKKTNKLVSMIEQLATMVSIANKPLSDEYQYHVMILGQKMKEKRELANSEAESKK